MAADSTALASPEHPDGSGPSDIRQRAKKAERAMKRVCKASRGLILGLNALFVLLGMLGITLDIASLPADDETASAAWRQNRQQFKLTLIQVYDAADAVLEMALRAEKHMVAWQHEVMMHDVLFLRRLIMQVLPQELFDHVVGKGKEPKGKE